MDHASIRTLLRRLFAGAAIDANDALRSCRATLGSLPIVTHALVNRGGKTINVVTSHDTPTGATDGKTIYIRPLPIPDSTRDLDTFVMVVALAYGLIHHEVGHINDSDFGLLGSINAKQKESGLVMSCFGAVEDVRQELVHIALNPGSKPYLDALNAALQLAGQFCPIQEDTEAVPAFTGYLLYRLYYEYRRDSTCADLYESASTVVRAKLPQTVFTRLDALLSRVPALKTSEDSYNLAVEIAAMLEDEARQEQEKEQEPSDASENGNPAGEGTAGDGSTVPSQDQPGSSQGAPDEGTQASNGSGSAPSFLQQILDQSSSTDGYGDKDKRIHAALDSQSAAVESRSTPTLSIERALNPSVTRSQKPCDPIDFSEALSVTAVLRTRLLREIQTLTSVETIVGVRGRVLSGRHLHRLCVGDGKVFRRTSEEVSLDTAVMLITDTSSSMDELAGHATRLDMALQASYATASALEGIEKVAVGCLAFPRFEILKSLGERRSQASRYQFTSAGGTPLCEAITQGRLLLNAARERRKLMIVMTDGDPDNRITAGMSIDAAERDGIEVIGIGMQSNTGEGLFRSWSTLNNLSELPTKLLSLIRDRLLGIAKAA